MSRLETDLHERAAQAVRVVTESNRLQKRIAAIQRDLTDAEGRLAAATERRDGHEAAQLQRAMREHERALQETQAAGIKHGDVVDKLKSLMREEEEAVRRKNAEALRRCETWEGRQEAAEEFAYIGATLLLMAVVASLFLWLK